MRLCKDDTRAPRCAPNATILLAAGLLAGCGGGGGNSSAGPEPPGPNRAPTISGSPTTTVAATVAYSFTPIANDADGDVLTFEIRGRPSWASFSSSTGTLSGTPGVGTVGTYGNIEILVSDGQAQSALPAFSLTVTPAPSGPATLIWQRPTLNDDGTPLDDLAGYAIRYGQDPTNLGARIDLMDPEVTTLVIEDLIYGTWFFTITSVNSSGVESDPTGLVSKTIG